MKQATKVLTEIPDVFKIRIIKAIRSSGGLMKSESKSVSSFLEEALHEGGGYVYKHEVMKTMKLIVESHPETSATCKRLEVMSTLHFSHPSTDLHILSEYVEDCDFPTLAIKAIDFIETYGKKSDNPSRYIRCLYNRLSLESASVRATSVSAIAGFAYIDRVAKDKIMVLLKKCFDDPNGEVRDRAFFHYKILEGSDVVKNAVDFGELETPL